MESYVGGERETEWNRQINKLIAKMSSLSLFSSLSSSLSFSSLFLSVFFLYLPEIHTHIHNPHVHTDQYWILEVHGKCKLTCRTSKTQISQTSPRTHKKLINLSVIRHDCLWLSRIVFTLTTILLEIVLYVDWLYKLWYDYLQGIKESFTLQQVDYKFPLKDKSLGEF